ncbi:MAG: hypothetical protein EOO03_12975 [Chitinophagaceae bacterium]|nr:MAG: hypothetical protein EOO03_12975 [Chitinophagaceae bacterium]
MARFLLFTGLFFILFTGFPAAAQKVKTDLSDKQKRCFSEKCRSLGLPNPQFFYQNKININEAAGFRKYGVDLQQMSRRWNGFTALEQVLLVPYLVKAKVVGIEEAPLGAGQFRVIYNVAVEETISGEKLPEKIEIYSRSAGNNGSFFSFNNEPVLQLGEEAVLYLSEFTIAPQKQREKKAGEPVYEQISLKPDEKETKRVFVATLKYTSKNGQLFDAWNRPFAKEADFIRMAGNIYRLNKQKKFFSRSYC